MKQTEPDTFNKSNIIQLLRIFTQDELKEFDKFIRSPFHNNRSDVILYLEILKKFHPEFNHIDLNKNKIYSVLYPSGQYRDDVIRRLSSNLYKLGEEFAAYRNFRNDKYRYEKSILDFFYQGMRISFFLSSMKR